MQPFDPKAFRKILLLHARRYPKMEPADAVKLAYQSVFGGGHMIADPAKSLAFLAQERAQTRTDAFQTTAGAFLPIGLGRARMNLASDALYGLPDALLNRMFVRSAQEPAGDLPLFERVLEGVSRAAADGVFAFSAAALDAYLAEYRAAGYPMVHHSEPYRLAYRPAYRVVEGVYAGLLPSIVWVQRALDGGALPIDFPLCELPAESLRLLSALFDGVEFEPGTAADTLRVRAR